MCPRAPSSSMRTCLGSSLVCVCVRCAIVCVSVCVCVVVVVRGVCVCVCVRCKMVCVPVPTCRFSLHPVMNEAEFAHNMLPRPGVLSSFVVEAGGVITDFCSYYHLPSTVIRHPKHKVTSPCACAACLCAPLHPPVLALFVCPLFVPLCLCFLPVPLYTCPRVALAHKRMRCTFKTSESVPLCFSCSLVPYLLYESRESMGVIHDRCTKFCSPLCDCVAVTPPPQTLNAVYAYYTVPGANTLEALFSDMLILAKAVQFLCCVWCVGVCGHVRGCVCL